MSEDSPTVSSGPEAVTRSGAGLAPGQLFADRYRIVALLGTGGMGEVYRADDLRLAQAVALKLLPERFAESPASLERFRDEVRLARQVTHPNVCRVYDIGDHQGRFFISMEYVDGEDLASLLRRIGRLPGEKALQIARQLCAGLGAAHARGVLHRDLKPANVMLDGRGAVRIMDFGLAVPVDADTQGQVAGTPAYMAPEQFSGQGLSPRTDVYALGLILYELFAGRRTFDAASLEGWLREHRDGAVQPPSSLVSDLDPAVERVILRCLEKDPRQRPPSAVAVAAALPGGDPLSAALAAGETPSPELVAAAGEADALSPRAVAGLAAALLVATLAAAFLGQRASFLRVEPLGKSPDALDDRARELAAAIGYRDPPTSTARDVYADRAARRARNAGSAGAGTPFWPVLRYVYRESPRPLEARWFRRFELEPISWIELPSGHVTRFDPPLDLPGMVLMELSPAGRLLSFRGVCPEGRGGAPGELADLGPLFSAAGLDPARLSPATPAGHPHTAGDDWRAWEGVADHRRVRVEARSLKGVPVLFDVAPADASAAPAAGGGGLILLILGSIVGSVGGTLAWRNRRLGRADRTGARRLALTVFAGYALQWLLGASHVPTIHEADLATQGLSRAAWMAVLMWVTYFAIEPHIRRHFPQMLISWSRLVSGHPADPRVGRDVLAGCLAAALVSSAISALALTGPSLGWPPWFRGIDVDNLLGPATALSSSLGHVLSGLVRVFSLAFLLVVARVLLRREWLAAALLVLLLGGASLGGPPALVAGAFLVETVMVLVLLRLGLVAGLALAFAVSIDRAALALGAPSWAASAWVAPGLVFLALVAHGLYAALRLGTTTPRWTAA